MIPGYGSEICMQPCMTTKRISRILYRYIFSWSKVRYIGTYLQTSFWPLHYKSMDKYVYVNNVWILAFFDLTLTSRSKWIWPFEGIIRSVWTLNQKTHLRQIGGSSVNRRLDISEKPQGKKNWDWPWPLEPKRLMQRQIWGYLQICTPKSSRKRLPTIGGELRVSGVREHYWCRQTAWDPNFSR